MNIKTATLKGSEYGSAKVYYIEDPALFSPNAIFHADHSSGISRLCVGTTEHRPYDKIPIYEYRYKGFPMYNPSGPSLLSNTHTIYTNEKGQPHNLDGPATVFPWSEAERSYAHNPTKREYYLNGQPLHVSQLFYYLSAMGDTARLQQFLFSEDEEARFYAKQILAQDE